MGLGGMEGGGGRGRGRGVLQGVRLFESVTSER